MAIILAFKGFNDAGQIASRNQLVNFTYGIAVASRQRLYSGRIATEGGKGSLLAPLATCATPP
jgi:hypothetical protein